MRTGRLRQALREIEQQLQQRLAVTLQEYETARMQAERYRTSLLPSAAKSLDLTRELYRAGETNYTALLTAQHLLAAQPKLPRSGGQTPHSGGST